MSLSDIPQTSGQATGGAEGIRFVNDTMYDALVAWDLSHSDRALSLIPGLASSWSVDPATKKVWTFKLRPGVIFHDGSAFDAHAVVWNSKSSGIRLHPNTTNGKPRRREIM